MKQETLLSHVDHTQLGITATWQDMKTLCDEALHYRTASVCVPPRFVAPVAEYLKEQKSALGILTEERPAVCTVIGFPNGYSTTATKCFEAKDAVEKGADEIDMVIAIGLLKEGNTEALLSEINAVKAACGPALLKVIVETCVLTPEEIATVTKVVDASDADYIKTSTGFSTKGATREDVRIFRENIAGDTKIKAAGGIASLKDAEDFLALGAERLGTSRIVKIIQAEEETK